MTTDGSVNDSIYHMLFYTELPGSKVRCQLYSNSYYLSHMIHNILSYTCDRDEFKN